MATVGFVGTGLIGAGLAEAALGRGDEVWVWNRTAARADGVVALGARRAESLETIAQRAPEVHIALTADDAVDAVTTQLVPHLRDNSILVDHSTVLPDRTRSRARQLADSNIRYLHAPVFMSPEACRKSAGVMVASGPRSHFDAVKSRLAEMTGQVLYVGDDPGLAATYKLFGNAMILSVLGGLADAFAIASAEGAPPTAVLDLFESFPLAVILTGRGRNMAAGRFDPAWTLEMARKDLGLMLQTAGDAPSAVLAGLGRRMDTLIDAGFGQADVGVICAESRPAEPK